MQVSVEYQTEKKSGSIVLPGDEGERSQLVDMHPLTSKLRYDNIDHNYIGIQTCYTLFTAQNNGTYLRTIFDIQVTPLASKTETNSTSVKPPISTVGFRIIRLKKGDKLESIKGMGSNTDSYPVPDDIIFHHNGSVNLATAKEGFTYKLDSTARRAMKSGDRIMLILFTTNIEVLSHITWNYTGVMGSQGTGVVEDIDM